MSKELLKRKILCPEKIHLKFKYEKILLGFEERGNKVPLVFYVHCDDMKCKRWFKVVFDENGCYYVKPLPKNYHIDFHKIPVPVHEY